MFTNLWMSVSWALGLELESKDLNIWRMGLRACIAFSVAVIMLRVGDKRFMGKSTAFDVILGIVFGSVISRAITGNAPFIPTLAAAFTLVILHWTLAAIAFRSPRFSALVKGREQLLVQNGEIQWKAMKKVHITEHDLHEALRTKGNTTDIRNVKSACLERDGKISIILQEHSS